MAATQSLGQLWTGRGIDFETGKSVPMASREQWAAMEADRLDRTRKSMAGHNRLVRIGQVASVAPFAVAGGAALAGGAAAGSAGVASVPGAVGASAAPLGVGTVTAGATGGGMTLGNIWNLANLGVQGASSLFGMRSNNNALNKQMQMQQREIDARMAADAEARAEAKRQFDATQANTARQFAADDEERAYNRRILDEREARSASRRAYSDRARQRLAQFLGLG